MTAQAGQDCSLLTRTPVHESLFDKLVGRVKVEGLIQAGRNEGAQIAYSGASLSTSNQ